MRRRARHRPDGQGIARTCLEFMPNSGKTWSVLSLSDMRKPPVSE